MKGYNIDNFDQSFIAEYHPKEKRVKVGFLLSEKSASDDPDDKKDNNGFVILTGMDLSDFRVFIEKFLERCGDSDRTQKSFVQVAKGEEKAPCCEASKNNRYACSGHSGKYSDIINMGENNG